MTDGKVGARVQGPGGEDFVIDQFIGRGAFGEVFRAIGESSGRIVAVKFLSLEGIEERTARLAITNEMSNSQLVSHPNVVAVLRVSENDKPPLGPFLIMEFVGGGTLEDKLRGHRKRGELIPLEDARVLMTGIAKGAAAINDRLVHRDIKPDNILLDGGRPKIGDLGISKLVDHRTRAETFKGIQAIGYMSPEAWRGGENTPKMDVYSVGMIFFEILTLQHPLGRNLAPTSGIDEWRQAHLYQTCPNVRELREDAEPATAELLQRMMAKLPEDRPTWKEVLDTLEGGKRKDPGDASISKLVALAAGQRSVAVDARRRQRMEREQMEQAAEEYNRACNRALDVFLKVVKEFNAEARGQEITYRALEGREVDFSLPGASVIEVRFFHAQPTGIKIQDHELVGGGQLRLIDGIGGNLLLLRGPSPAHSLKWIGCLVRISPLVDPQQVLSRRRLSRTLVQPFGFEAPEDFYEEIRWAGGGIHVFTFEIREDIRQLFIDMLETAFSLPPTKT